MSRNYQREDRDWRRQQPSSQEEDQWSNSRSDDDFSMGLGQESRGSRGEDYNRRGQESTGRGSGRDAMSRTPGQYSGYNSGYGGRERDYAPEGYGGRDMGWDQGNEGFQNSSRWQRSQFRPSEGDSSRTQQYGSGRTSGMRWNEPYDGAAAPQRGWYEGVQDAMHRGEGPFTGRGPRNYKRSDERIEEDINERLTRHGMVDATDVDVSVQNGEVVLRGFVDSRQAKRVAEDIADAVSGVKEITNQIKVKQKGESNEGSDKQEPEATGKNQRKAS